jgi:hypothetical protein
MTFRRTIVARIAVGRSRWSPFVAPTLVVLAGGSLVGGTVTMLDSSVLSVQDRTQHAHSVAVQEWAPARVGAALTPLGSVVFGHGAAAVVARDAAPGQLAFSGRPRIAAGSQSSADASASSAADLGSSVREREHAPNPGTGPVSSPQVTPGVADSDDDGLTDQQELALGTNPLVIDTDGDGLPDGWEVRYRRNPLVAEAPKVDSDGDGVPDSTEFALGLDPTKVTSSPSGIDDGSDDTDGDGVANAVEVLLGSDPGDASSLPDAYKPAAPQPLPAAPPAPDPAPVAAPEPEVVPAAVPGPQPEVASGQDAPPSAPAPASPAQDPEPAPSDPDVPVIDDGSSSGSVTPVLSDPPVAVAPEPEPEPAPEPKSETPETPVAPAETAAGNAETPVQTDVPSSS